MSLKRLGLGAAVLTAAALAHDSQPFTMDAEKRIFRDANGRHTIFHGVNVVYKVDPYIPWNGEFDA